MEISQGKKEVKLNTVRQAEDLVKARIERVGTVMDDYDGCLLYTSDAADDT